VSFYMRNNSDRPSPLHPLDHEAAQSALTETSTDRKSHVHLSAGGQPSSYHSDLPSVSVSNRFGTTSVSAGIVPHSRPIYKSGEHRASVISELPPVSNLFPASAAFREALQWEDVRLPVPGRYASPIHYPSSSLLPIPYMLSLEVHQRTPTFPYLTNSELSVRQQPGTGANTYSESERPFAALPMSGSAVYPAQRGAASSFDSSRFRLFDGTGNRNPSPSDNHLNTSHLYVQSPSIRPQKRGASDDPQRHTSHWPPRKRRKQMASARSQYHASHTVQPSLSGAYAVSPSSRGSKPPESVLDSAQPQDLWPPKRRKPPEPYSSYATLLADIIRHHGRGKMTLNELYDYLQTFYPQVTGHDDPDENEKPRQDGWRVHPKDVI